MPCTPLFHAQLAGLFYAFFLLMKYEKPVLGITDQIALLKSRGLEIKDEGRAAKYLESVGYYRLTGYMYHLQLADGSHSFKENTTFCEIIETYQFDKKLRYLISEYIERIEVATRALLTNMFSVNYGFFWYIEPDRYMKPLQIGTNEDGSARMAMDVHKYICDYVRDYYSNPSELFLRSFQSKYTSEVFPPSNMAMEILTMGKLSKMYAALKKEEEAQNVARAFNLPIQVFSSWLTYLTNVRNVCAHHSRLWNRRVTANQFVIPAKKSLQFNGELPDGFNTSMYGTLSVMIRLLSGINPQNSLLDKFKRLVNDYPCISMIKMGFPEGWEKSPAWIIPGKE